MNLFIELGSAINPIFGQNDPTMERSIELPKAYHCDDCDCFFDIDGIEISRFDAVDNYDIEYEICDNCKNYNEIV